MARAMPKAHQARHTARVCGPLRARVRAMSFSVPVVAGSNEGRPGNWFVLLMAVCAFLLWRGRLYTTRGALWALLLTFPFPCIANTAGWMTAEPGRQPWLIYQRALGRRQDAHSILRFPGNP